MMTPRSPSASGLVPCMSAATSRIMLKVPIRLILMTRSKSPSGIGPSRPTIRFAGPMPAQLIKMRATPCLPRGLGERRRGLLGIGDVATHGDAADLVRHFAGAVEIDVEAGDLGAGACELVGGRGAEAGGAAGYDRGVSFDVHGQFVRVGVAVKEGASGFSTSSAMPWPPPMQAEAMP